MVAVAPRLSPEQYVVGYQDAVAQVRESVVTFARAAWLAQGSYRDGDVDRLVGLIVPRVQAGQVKVANLTAAYIAAVASLRDGKVVDPTPVDADEVTTGRGVPAAEVYRRPAVETYTALSAGVPFAEAVGRAVTRLESLASTDLQMARVRQARSSYRAAGRRRFRRTLTGNENCALCAVASTQRYWVEDLLPIHPGCDCGVSEILSDEPDRQVIDRALLDEVQRRAGEFAGTNDLGARDLGLGKRTASGRNLSDYTDLIITRNHGEYGPTLSWRADKFTRAADLA